MSWLVQIVLDGLNSLFNLTGSYGIAIILLTVVIRTMLLPITISQTRSQLKMQELNPKMAELREKFKNDKDRLNRETMELWKKHKVNPLSGCLLAILQLPFLLAVFYALRQVEYQGAARFLFFNLAEPDPWILPLLAGVTTFWQSKLMGMADPSQRTMTYVFPVLIAWISRQFPSGLAMYWVVANLYGVGERYVMALFRKQGEETAR
ncbi:MAG: YidC/Oxa1 family membrane protein insertase [bacterium]|nr:YidC/Oxa1 family membrane protein insertase [bacterium]